MTHISPITGTSESMSGFSSILQQNLTQVYQTWKDGVAASYQDMHQTTDANLSKIDALFIQTVDTMRPVITAYNEDDVEATTNMMLNEINAFVDEG